VEPRQEHQVVLENPSQELQFHQLGLKDIDEKCPWRRVEERW